MTTASTESTAAPDYDVLIVGAGLSGISAAVHLQRDCPDTTFAIVERRAALGGTWDLFRYPGIRSDSDMHTLGFSFEPWVGASAIADGGEILTYLRETARKYGVDRAITYETSVLRASWSSTDALWTVELRDERTNDAQTSAEKTNAEQTSAEQTNRRRVTCRVLWSCAGYYDYDAGYTPDFAGREAFKGLVVHPQHWPEDLDVTGKRVAVIGSGATAVTLLPSLAKTAAHVTMVQRSPSYVVSRPRQSVWSRVLRGRVPDGVFHRVLRTKMVSESMFTFAFARRFPGVARRVLERGVQRRLGPDFDVGEHFSPRYDPWDQRVCLTPDNALFNALASGQASVRTGEIEGFTEDGIRMRSGDLVDADVIVTATGLTLRFLGGIEVAVDGAPVRFSERMVYKGMMCNGVPNLVMTAGYTNASWTLKADLTSAFVCRVINHCARQGARSFCPRLPRDRPEETPLLDFTSGYVARAKDVLPKQGDRAPWRLYQNYVFDLMSLRYGSLDDHTLEFEL